MGEVFGFWGYDEEGMGLIEMDRWMDRWMSESLN